MEEWLNINGYENYLISNLGSVKNTKTGLCLKPQLSSNGYYNVTLCKNGKKSTPLIHRLVAEHFLSKINQTVNHIDGNKLNNNINNLEWITYSENLTHAHKSKLRKKTHKKNKKNTSGKVGVVFDKSRNHWIARMHKNSIPISLGCFKNKEDAIKARIEAEKLYE